MASSTIINAVCATRSRIVGIPSGLCLPFGLGMYTRRTACAWYVFFLRASASSPSHRSSPYASMSSNVSPSTPAAPLLARQQA